MVIGIVDELNYLAAREVGSLTCGSLEDLCIGCAAYKALFSGGVLFVITLERIREALIEAAYTLNRRNGRSKSGVADTDV